MFYGTVVGKTYRVELDLYDGVPVFMEKGGLSGRGERGNVLLMTDSAGGKVKGVWRDTKSKKSVVERAKRIHGLVHPESGYYIVEVSRSYFDFGDCDEEDVTLVTIGRVMGVYEYSMEVTVLYSFVFDSVDFDEEVLRVPEFLREPVRVAFENCWNKYIEPLYIV